MSSSVEVNVDNAPRPGIFLTDVVLGARFKYCRNVYLLVKFSKVIESLKMSVVFCCLKNCFDGIGLSQNNIQRREVNPIVLDTGHMGKFETCSLHINPLV